MNKEKLLSYVFESLELEIERQDEWLSEQDWWNGGKIDGWDTSDGDLNEQILELYSRRERSCIYPPANLPGKPEEMIPILRKTYKDDVAKISLVLHHYFPDKYLFYRISKLQGEIFQGFEFFSEVIPEFHFDFDRIRRTSFDDYLR